MNWWRLWSRSKSDAAEDAVEAVLDNLIDAVLIVGPDGVTRFANKTAEQIFGRPIAELLQRPFGFPATPGRATEAQIPRPDGSSAEVEIRAVSIHYEGESCALTTIRDITTSVRSRTILREQELRFAGIFDNAPVGMALVTLDGRLIRINRTICETLGYTREELLRMDMQTLTHSDDRDISRLRMEQIRREEINHYQLKKRYIAKDGSIVHAIFTVNLVVDDYEQPLYLIAHLVNINPTVEAEKQLQQMQKMESLGQLTGGVAHDFNNILAVIMGNLQLIQRKIGNMPQVTELANRGLAAGKRGAELTQRLLSFSHQQSVAAERIDLNGIVADLLDMLDRTLGPQVELFTELAADLWPTVADVGQLENAILNLCINARDAMPQGGQITLTTANAPFDANFVAAHSYAQQGDYVALYVTDTGTGIPPAIIDRIFEPFFTTKPKGKGTGLGLSSVFGFVKQSGGYLDVHSEPGHTTMKVYLPRLLERSDQKPVGITETGYADLHGWGRILIVDDEPDLVLTIESILQSYGYRTAVATSGRQALDVLENDDTFDLVLSDVLMPGGINGVALAERLLTSWPDMPVILMSGFTNSIEVDSAHPRIELLSKPFSELALLRKVQKAIKRQRTYSN